MARKRTVTPPAAPRWRCPSCKQFVREEMAKDCQVCRAKPALALRIDAFAVAMAELADEDVMMQHLTEVCGCECEVCTRYWERQT